MLDQQTQTKYDELLALLNKNQEDLQIVKRARIGQLALLNNATSNMLALLKPGLPRINMELNITIPTQPNEPKIEPYAIRISSNDEPFRTSLTQFLTDFYHNQLSQIQQIENETTQPLPPSP